MVLIYEQVSLDSLELVGLGVYQLLVHVIVLSHFAIPIPPQRELLCVHRRCFNQPHHYIPGYISDNILQKYNIIIRIRSRPISRTLTPPPAVPLNPTPAACSPSNWNPPANHKSARIYSAQKGSLGKIGCFSSSKSKAEEIGGRWRSWSYFQSKLE